MDYCHVCHNPLLGDYYGAGSIDDRKFHKICFKKYYSLEEVTDRAIEIWRNRKD